MSMSYNKLIKYKLCCQLDPIRDGRGGEADHRHGARERHEAPRGLPAQLQAAVALPLRPRADQGEWALLSSGRREVRQMSVRKIYQKLKAKNEGHYSPRFDSGCVVSVSDTPSLVHYIIPIISSPIFKRIF